MFLDGDSMTKVTFIHKSNESISQIKWSFALIVSPTIPSYGSVFGNYFIIYPGFLPTTLFTFLKSFALKPLRPYKCSYFLSRFSLIIEKRVKKVSLCKELKYDKYSYN